MKKNNFFLIVGASLMMISMVAFSPFNPTKSLPADYSAAQVLAINSITSEMSSIVGKYGSLTAISDPGDLLAYRWLAMAKDYVALGSFASAPVSSVSPAGTAMANIVAKYGSLTSISDPGDLLAYRWLAMAKQYGH